MISDLQRRLINRYQGGVPVIERPYAEMAKNLGCSEQQLLENLHHMLEEGTLTRFGPLYDAAKLGGGLTLAALSVPEGRFEEVAELVNAFPEVAHNYQREHVLNMWFVLATESALQLQDSLKNITLATRLPVLNFPKQQEFYVGLWLHIDEQDGVDTVPVPQGDTTSCRAATPGQLERAIIQHTQQGLELVSDPWNAVARAIGCDGGKVLQCMEDLLASGVARRIGAVPNHYRLGLKANGMTVWDIDDDRAHDAGEAVGRLGYVSHCYLRPRHLPAWRYNLFAMVHGCNRQQVEEKRRQIAEILGARSRADDVLLSSRILKKTGLRLAA